MDAITLDTVRSLAEFRAQRGRALSLYLDLDPSTTPTAAELDSRISSLLSRARDEVQDIDSHDGRVGVGEDIERIEAFFGGEFERNGARGVALFSDGPDGLWRVVELPEPVEDALSLGDELNLAPLAPLLGRQDALVLVGTDETTASFRDQLSVEAQAAVVGTAHAEAHATPAELLDVVGPVLDEAAAARERDVLERWREAVAREEGRGAAGWERTLTAASDGKVACLVFAAGAAHEAVRCPECGRVEAAGDTCPLDGAPLQPVADGLGAAIRQVLGFGGDLIPVRHHQDLDPLGGIGALLRF